MPEDALQRASLAYRRGYEKIWSGEVPEKYTRLLPYTEGRRILEIGAAEGVLSLLIAREEQCEAITGLEWRAVRHQEGLRLQARWRELGFPVDRCTLLCGDIKDRLDLFAGMDTLVAVRTVYYLEGSAPRVMLAAFQAGVARVVLCGNAGRQANARAHPDTPSGRFDHLASIEGMRGLLEGAGYGIARVHDQGDPIVIGHHPDRA